MRHCDSVRRLVTCLLATAVIACLPGSRVEAVEPNGAASKKPLRVAYVHDGAAQQAANLEKRNHWDVYLREILDQLGLRADEIPAEALADAAVLDRYAALLVGNLRGETAAVQTNLTRWVESGGNLILFSTAGLHELCGNTPLHATVSQPDGEFSCAATFALKPHGLTDQIHSPLQPDQRLLVFSPAELVHAAESVELARLFDLDGGDTGCPAVTWRKAGAGQVSYWAFSVPQTVWVLHQGRPVDRDFDGDNILRRSDALVIRPHSFEVAYADEILFLLQNMLALQPHPFVHQLPPAPDGRIPDAVFHWGGDDEGSADGIQLFASNWMKEHGLPYHINAMPREDLSFGLSSDDARRIKENGHEISIHFNFVDGFAKGTGFSRDDVLAQAAAFRRHFNQDWICSVNHWTRWTGWAEPARWMLEAGGKSDNTFVHAGSPPGNPVNLLGYSFGTAFPFWFYDDWRGENQRIDFLEQPITAYECGYVGQERPDFATIHKVVDMAAHYHQTMNMFFHPIYIAKFPHCRAAIEEMLRYLDERKLQPLHWGNDEIYSWWKARSATRVSEVACDGRTLHFDVTTEYPTGAIAKIPLDSKDVASVTVNGAVADVETEQRFGRQWVLIVVPQGRADVRIEQAE